MRAQIPGGGSMHPVAKAHRKRQEAFEAPGKYQPDLAVDMSRKRKVAREAEAVSWLASVKARKPTGHVR